MGREEGYPCRAFSKKHLPCTAPTKVSVTVTGGMWGNCTTPPPLKKKLLIELGKKIAKGTKKFVPRAHVFHLTGVELFSCNFQHTFWSLVEQFHMRTTQITTFPWEGSFSNIKEGRGRGLHWANPNILMHFPPNMSIQICVFAYIQG